MTDKIFALNIGGTIMPVSCEDIKNIEKQIKYIREEWNKAKHLHELFENVKNMDNEQMALETAQSMRQETDDYGVTPDPNDSTEFK